MVDYYDSEIELVDDVVVLSLAGETDLATAPRLRRDLDQAMELTSGDVVLDLADLELLDSTALGILMAAGSRMMTEQRSLVLVVERIHVLRVFAVTGLLSFFSIAATRGEAMTRLSSAPGGEDGRMIRGHAPSARTGVNRENEGGVTCCSGSCF